MSPERVFLETADVAGTLVTTNITEATTITTSVTDSGNTYYYMYITQGNNIDKVTTYHSVTIATIL